jgi:thiol-disulfide isomerase/thioredoxin
MARRKRELVMDALVGLMAVLALSLLVRERLIPWFAERSVVDPGEPVQPSPDLVLARSGDSVPFRRGEASLLLVFRSTCEACARALPAWNRLAGEARWSTTAIGLEDAATASAYAADRLPDARVAVPRDIDRFAFRFRVAVVPTTLLIDREGRLVARRAGPLEEHDVQALRRLVGLPAY